jgi:hypothetical protein
MHPVREVKAFLKNVDQIGKYMLMTHGVLTTIVLMIFLLSDRIRESWRRFMGFWPIVVPAVSVLVMYAMVHWEPRYTSGIMLVGCGTVMASTCISQEERRVKVLRAASLMLGAMVVFWELAVLMHSYGDSGQWAQQVVVAERLRTMGIKQGDYVALIGDGLHDQYWARLEKVKIIAELPHNLEPEDPTAVFWNSAAFWNSNQENEQAVLTVLKNTGAKAAIADTPPRLLPPGWVQIGNTGHAVYFFR